MMAPNSPENFERPRSILSGNPSYGGYDYQIQVTVWVGLDLIFAKQVTDKIFIEPPSHEDIEAELNVDSNDASVNLNIPEGGIDLIIQIKSKSTGPWSSSNIKEILLGNPSTGKNSKGPKPRIRPLEILKTSPRKHYIFISDAGLETGLMPYKVDSLLEWPDAKQLPPGTRQNIAARDQTAIANRLAFCATITNEILNSRISNILSLYCHVPALNLSACLNDFKEQIRQRLLGNADGIWTKDDVIAVLLQNGGAILPNRSLDHYVTPSSYANVVQALEIKHVVLITGPSGTGKTLTADIIEENLRRSNPPFLVVGGDEGPSSIRKLLAQPSPMLFHLRDPWGANRLAPGADRWSNELPKLLRLASVEKKFLITSRSDILYSAGQELSQQLRPYMVPIEIEDYDSKARAKIYDNLCTDLASSVRVVARSCRDRVVKALLRPFEIDRFLAGLCANPGGETRLLIANSQIDAISRVVTQQLSENTDKVMAAAILWGLLSARPVVGQSVIPSIRRQMMREDPNFRPGIEALVDFLVEGRNLRLDNGFLSFYHPKVEDGLRLAIIARPADTEHALGLLCDALVSIDDEGEDWGAESAIEVKKAVTKLDNITPPLAPQTEDALDKYLERRAVSSGIGTFERMFDDLARYGSGKLLSSNLARILVQRTPRSGFFGNQWISPDLSSEKITLLKTNPTIPILIDRFIREILPYSHTFYGAEVVDLVRVLNENAAASFMDAAVTVAQMSSPSMNVDTIVRGALGGGEPPYEEIFQIFLAAKNDIDTWFEEFSEKHRRAEEHEVDAQYADHLIEEPGERYHNVNEGLGTLVQTRRECEGFDWLLTHPARSDLVESWIDVLASTTQTISEYELKSLIDATEDGLYSGKAWSVVAKHWDVSLAHQLLRELVRTDLHENNFRESLIQALSASTGDGKWVDNLINLAKTTTDERALEIVVDILYTNFNKDQEYRFHKARRIAAGLDDHLKSIALAITDAIEGKELNDIVQSLSADIIPRITTILHTSHPRVAAPLACIGALLGINPLQTSKRLLALDDPQVGRSAVLALTLFRSDENVIEIKNALKHPRWKVRREAMRHLVRHLPPNERDSVVEMTNDRSADVRLDFARLMEHEHWPEARNALISLLSDTRDFNNGGSILKDSWPVYKVARAAAHALKKDHGLQKHHITEMIRLATTSSSSIHDSFVICSILNALADKKDHRIDTILAENLSSPGIGGSSEYRPIAQAAAWALFDRSVNSKLIIKSKAMQMLKSAAVDPYGLISGPVIAAVGLSGNAHLVRMLEKPLSSYSLSTRAELLLLTAAFILDFRTCRELAKSLNLIGKPVTRLVEITISHKDNSEDPGYLASKESSVIEWSRSLDPRKDVEGVTAWIINHQFNLPIGDTSFDPRAYILPQRRPLLTMRSLTPMREEENVAQEDGR